MKENEFYNPAAGDRVHGYEIKRSILFENDRGFAYAENPNAPQPFVTWQFTEENGKRDYYWGHYTKNADTALKDYEARIEDYQRSYGVSEKTARPAPEVYKYYFTQRPVDIGTFPKTENSSAKIVNFDKREEVENGRFRAWGYLLYAEPLTQKQMDDYELRAAPGNPDLQRLDEMVQAVGQWEEKRKMPDRLRLTWWYPDFGSFVKKEFVTPEQLEERHSYIVGSQARAAQKRAKKKADYRTVESGGGAGRKGQRRPPRPRKEYGKGQITELRANLARSRKKEVFHNGKGQLSAKYGAFHRTELQYDRRHPQQCGPAGSSVRPCAGGQAAG